MQTAIPSLSKRGFSTDPQANMLILFEHALAADAHQSNLHQGNVVSVQRIVIDNSQNPDQIASVLQNQLEKYYSRHYSDVTSEISAREIIETGLWQLDIHISGTVNGEQYSLAKQISLEKDTNNFKLITELYENV